MKEKLLKVLAIVCTLTMLVGVIAGCGNGAVNESGGDTQQDSTEESSSNTVAATGDSSAAEYTLIFSTGDTEKTCMGQMWQKWANKVNEVTDGRVYVEMHWNGELVESAMAMTAIQQGTVDVAFVPTTVDSAFQLDLLREMVPSASTCQRPTAVYMEMLSNSEEMAEPYSPYKVVVAFSMADGMLATKGEPIASPEDIAGKNIAVVSSIQAEYIKSMGGSAIFVEPNGEYTSLEKGIIDGGMSMPMDNFITNSWAEQIDYITMMPSTNCSTSVLMNIDTWNSLPADIQEQIDGITDWFVDLIDTTMWERAMECMEICEKEYGIEFVFPTEEQKSEFDSYKEAAVDNYVAELNSQGYDATAFMELYYDTLEKFSTEEYRIIPEFDYSQKIW